MVCEPDAVGCAVELVPVLVHVWPVGADGQPGAGSGACFALIAQHALAGCGRMWCGAWRLVTTMVACL